MCLLSVNMASSAALERRGRHVFCALLFPHQQIVSLQRRFIFSWRGMNKSKRILHSNSMDFSISPPFSHGFFMVGLRGWVLHTEYSVIRSLNKLSTSCFLWLFISLKHTYIRKRKNVRVAQKLGLWTWCRYERRFCSFMEATEGKGQGRADREWHKV